MVVPVISLSSYVFKPRNYIFDIHHSFILTKLVYHLNCSCLWMFLLKHQQQSCCHDPYVSFSPVQQPLLTMQLLLHNLVLLVAQVLSQLLSGLKATGKPPDAWHDAMTLCHATLEPEAMPQVEAEHALLRDAFADAGIANAATLDLLLPLPRYAQLLGAAQLNAFELQMSHGLVVSCLLPCEASFFNHSCQPKCASRARHSNLAERPVGTSPLADTVAAARPWLTMAAHRDGGAARSSRWARRTR